MQRIQTLPPIPPEEIHNLARSILMMGMTRTESHEIEPGVWEHIFTPRYWEQYGISEFELRASSIDVRLESIRRKVNALQQRISTRMRKQERARKLKARQRRAAQRRHNRGMR